LTPLPLPPKAIHTYLGEENIKAVVNFALKYIADLDIPIKRFVALMHWYSQRLDFSPLYHTFPYRGTFIEFRSGMLNISPIGRNCSQSERDEYEKFDLVSFPSSGSISLPPCYLCPSGLLFSNDYCTIYHLLFLLIQANNIRKNMVEVMQEKFAHLKLKFSIGGQISFDVFPEGWDKTYCLKFIADGEYDEIHFFGDKTFVGGNDYEIFTHPRVLGHTVTSPDDTKAQCSALFGL
jgi:phosphomannomutase